MPNVLKFEKRVRVIAALAENMSIRGTERMTGVHRDTVMRLAIRVGRGCAIILDEVMRNLHCRVLQMDELWGFINKKAKNVRRTDPADFGDVWTFVCLDSESKAIPAYRVGKRDGATANAFVTDVADRLANRVQLSTDALSTYVEAVERGFGGDVDYGQVVKSFSSTAPLPADRRYSPPDMVSVKKTIIVGDPDEAKISTSHIEKQNHTTRMHCRRLSRLTNAFSKRLPNFIAAVGLHFGYYNLVKINRAVRMTPAMAIGAVPTLWTTERLVKEALDAV